MYSPNFTTKKVKILKTLLVIFAILSIAISAYAMNYIFGLGYSPGRSWVVSLGAMNKFNDELSLNIFTPASTSQSMIYDVKATIPVVGRDDLNKGFRLGPVFNMITPSQIFNVGIYGQYYFGPWRFEADVLKNIFTPSFSFSFEMWYFFSSSKYHFTDYLIANIRIDKNLPYISMCLIEPF